MTVNTSTVDLTRHITPEVRAEATEAIHANNNTETTYADDTTKGRD